MNSPSRHHHPRAGWNQDWVLANVQPDAQKRTLTLPLEFDSESVVCPECGAAYSIRVHAAERRCCHLDAMQLHTILTARVPRCSGETCGVKTISVPWADKQRRFTLLFEAFAHRCAAVTLIQPKHENLLASPRPWPRAVERIVSPILHLLLHSDCRFPPLHQP